MAHNYKKYIKIINFVPKSADGLITTRNRRKRESLQRLGEITFTFGKNPVSKIKQDTLRHECLFLSETSVLFTRVWGLSRGFSSFNRSPIDSNCYAVALII